MGIHCLYTARLSTDSFICGVDQLSFAVGGHRGNSTLAYRGAATTPRLTGTLLKPSTISIYSPSRTPEQPVSYHSSSMFLRVMGTTCVATQHYELGVQFSKAPFNEKPSISIFNPTYFSGGGGRLFLFLQRATEGTAPSPTEGPLVQTPKQNIKSRVRIPWVHLFTLTQLLSLQHSVPLAGLLWLSKIRLHCPPHLTMGIHCFYTARLSADSFICGVEQLPFAVGGHRGNSTLAYRGAATTPRYPPPVYKAPHGHQNNRSLTTLRVCFWG